MVQLIRSNSAENILNFIAFLFNGNEFNYAYLLQYENRVQIKFYVKGDSHKFYDYFP